MGGTDEGKGPARSEASGEPVVPAMRRSTFLKSAVGAFVGSGVLLNTAGDAAASASLAPGADRAKRQELQVTKVGNLTGPGLTTRFRMEATDLGVPVVIPDGRKLFVFGDTFEEAHVGGGWWRSPVALYSTTENLAGGVQWSGAVGGDAAKQLWPYEHNNPQFSTVLPSDVIVIGNTIYLHAMVNQGLHNVVWTEIWRSDDNGATWVHTGAKFPPDLHGGLFQLLTWAEGNDGYIYVYSTEFSRSRPIILHRVPSGRITDPGAYEPWGYAGGAWAWGNPPTPILDGRFGELCLRPLGGKWVFTWFNEGDYRIDGILMDTPTSNLHTAYRRTLLRGTDWGNEDDSHVAQLYGGYIIPGSSIGDLHLSVSQWDTVEGDDWPYRVMQFRVQGFGT